MKDEIMGGLKFLSITESLSLLVPLLKRCSPAIEDV